jgi:RNA polymerase sigma factor (sigma-70 family)
MNNTSDPATEDEAQRTRNRLVEEHFPLVRFQARRLFSWRTPGLDVDDLMQEGYIGLIRAVETYDPTKINPQTNKPYTFATYASTVIRSALLRALANKARTIYLPTYIWEEVVRLERLRNELWLRLQREPALDELAEAMHNTPAHIARLLEIQETKSLDASLVSADEDAWSLADLLVAPEPEQQTEEQQADVRHLLRYLHPEERRVIVCRYQLDPETASADERDALPLPYIEVARRLQMSRERVASIEKRALMKMRYWAERPFSRTAIL